MVYSVVHFFEDESVEAVPSSWVKKKLCAWPKNKSLVIKYIENKCVPNNREFIYFKARELVRGIKSLNEAKSKANEARYKSDFTDEDDGLLTKSKLNSPTMSMPIYLSPDKSREVKEKPQKSQNVVSSIKNGNSKRAPGWSPSPLKNKFLKTYLNQDLDKLPVLSSYELDKSKNVRQLAFNDYDDSDHVDNSLETSAKGKTIRQLEFNNVIPDDISAHGVRSVETEKSKTIRQLAFNDDHVSDDSVDFFETSGKSKSARQLSFNDNDVSDNGVHSLKTSGKSKTIRQLVFNGVDGVSALGERSPETGKSKSTRQLSFNYDDVSDDGVHSFKTYGKSTSIRQLEFNGNDVVAAHGIRSVESGTKKNQCFKTPAHKIDKIQGRSSTMSHQHDKVFENHMLRSSAFFKVELRQIQNNQAIMMEQIESILSHLQSTNKCVEKNNLTHDDFQDCPIPLDNEMDLNTLENKIAGDHQFKIRLVNELSYIGGKHVKAMVKRLMSKLFTDDVLSKYSFIGKKGKKPFSALFICSVILEAVKNQVKFKNISQNEIEDTIKYVLAQAPFNLKRQFDNKTVN